MRARTVYRSLLLRGLASGEAANVAAYLAGLRCGGIRWTLPEVEALVALHERWSGSRGPDDGPVRQLTWSRS